MKLETLYPHVALEHELAPIAEARAVRELAVMFADIAGSTGLYESLGDVRAHRLVAATLQLMTEATQACGGRMVKSVGDALLCTYPSAADAARGSIAIQQGLLALQSHEAEQVAVRIGFNFGSVVEAKGDVFGDSVNVAARLVGIAQGRQILTTASCIERLSPAHRSKARELQLIGVRGRNSYVPVWELLWRSQEQLTQRVVSPARQAREGLLSRLEFRGRVLELWREGDEVTIGRDGTSRFRLDSQFVSRHHARIVVRNGNVILIDQSTNGTYVQPAGGMIVGIMREEYVLSGNGTIGLGHLPRSDSTDSVHYSSCALPLSTTADVGENAPADRAGVMQIRDACDIA